MYSLFFYIAAVVLGIAIGYALPVLTLPKKISGVLQKIFLYILMVMMGISLGTDVNLSSYIVKIGAQAVLLAAAVVAGSIAMVILFERIFLRSTRFNVYYDGIEESQTKSAPLATTAMIVACIALGIMIVRLFSGRNAFLDTLISAYAHITTLLLVLMIFLAGFDIGQNKSVVTDIKQSGLTILFVPSSVMIGSVLASVIVGFSMKIPAIESAAIGAGCGWYSFIGIKLSETSAELGALAFLVNLFRELITFVITPFVAKRFGPLAAVAPAGGAAMDTAFSVIRQNTGPANAIIAFSTGIILTIIIPPVVSILQQFI